MKLKGQRTSKKILKNNKDGVLMKIDLPPSKLRCLRGEITNDELLVILKKVLNLQFSLAEMQKECCRTKEMRALQNFFVRGTECESWDDAKTKYVDV